MAVEFLNIILDGDKFVGFEDDLGREIQLGRWENGCLRIGADALAELDIVQGEIEEKIDDTCAKSDYEKSNHIDELKDQLADCQEEKERLENKICELKEQ